MNMGLNEAMIAHYPREDDCKILPDVKRGHGIEHLDGRTVLHGFVLADPTHVSYGKVGGKGRVVDINACSEEKREILRKVELEAITGRIPSFVRRHEIVLECIKNKIPVVSDIAYVESGRSNNPIDSREVFVYTSSAFPKYAHQLLERYEVLTMWGKSNHEYSRPMGYAYIRNGYRGLGGGYGYDLDWELPPAKD
jgi:hypothetical protein